MEGFSGGHVWGQVQAVRGDPATATARVKEQPTQAEAAVRSTCTPSKQRESDAKQCHGGHFYRTERYFNSHRTEYYINATVHD